VASEPGFIPIISANARAPKPISRFKALLDEMHQS